MKKVITYGSFDLFHRGHYRLLQRAKALGDYLIVGVTTEHFDEERGKLNLIDPILKRIENVKATGFADEIIVEDHVGQKVEDIQKYQADISHCGLMYFYPDGRTVPHYGTGTRKQQDHDTGLLDLLSGEQIEPSMCCKLYRRELFDDFDISDRIQYNGDLYCNFLLFQKANSAVYEDFCGYLYRQRHYSDITNVQSVKRMRGILNVRREILKMSTPTIHDAAYSLWLSTLVNIVPQSAATPAHPNSLQNAKRC